MSARVAENDAFAGLIAKPDCSISLQGAKLLGQTLYVEGLTLVEHAEQAGVETLTNRYFGNSV